MPPPFLLSESKMLQMKEAQKNNFATSTRKELRAYAEELGIEGVPSNADAKQLRKMVCNALGIAIDVEGRPAPMPEVTTTAGGDKIFPSYNLTPNGIWQGRRHRLSIPRPEGTRIGQAEQYNWNGKHPYWIAYDEVDAVPEPIYNLIVQNKNAIHKSVRPAGGGEGELTTTWEFAANPLNYYGVDEETKNRAGSLLEWYQARGSDWFRELTPRQLGQVARMLDVPTREYTGPHTPARILDADEILARVMEFLYSYADAKVAQNDTIEV